VEFLGGAIKWNVSFTRAAHDWEVEAFASFFRVLHLAKVRRVGRTSCGWSVAKRVCLVLNLSIESWVVMIVSVSHGKVFGELRFR
jgi:hypothetical protein